MINYSGACIAQKPIDPNFCQLDPFDLKTLTEYVTIIAL